MAAAREGEAGQHANARREGSPSRGVRRIALAAGAVVALLAAAWLALPAVLVRVVEEGGRALLGVEVEVAGIDWSLEPLGLRLREVCISAPGGAGDPLARASSASVRFAPGQRPWKSGTLAIEEVRVAGLELASAARGEDSSSLAEVQRHVRARRQGEESADGTQEHASEDAGVHGSVPWWTRFELGLLRIDDAELEASGADAAAVARIRLASFEARRVVVPVPAVEGAEASADFAVDGLEVSAPAAGGNATLLAAAHAEATVRGAVAQRREAAAEAREATAEAGEGGAGAREASLVIGVPRLAASGLVATLRMDDRGAFELDAFVDAWQAALAGLELPGVAAATIDDAVLSADRLLLEKSSAPRAVPLFATTATLRDYSVGRPRSVATVVEVETSPFEREARLRVDVAATVVALPPSPARAASPTDAAPAKPARAFQVQVVASRVPVHPFPALHLDRGLATTRASLRVADGVLSGPVTLRLDGIDVADGAPVKLKAAYAAFAASRTPELTVPLEVRLSHPDIAAITLAVTTALLERAGRDVGRTVGDAARGAGRTVGGAAAGVGRGLGRGWNRLAH